MNTIGGQAVIEGVMMKSRNGWSVAVRGMNGLIHLRRESLRERHGFWRSPVLRGIIALYDALSIGIRALEFSANKAYEGTEEKPMSRSLIVFTIMMALMLGVGLFILLPLYATKLLGIVIPAVSEKTVMFNLVDGLIRVFVFLIYIGIIGLWPEMKRIFEYHGAEHKVIHAYEAGRELMPEALTDMSTHHPRCGTSFLLIVMVVSIAVFSFIPQSWHFFYKFLSRLIFIPMVAGLSYELLRLSFKKKDNVVIRLLIMPGLALQRLTTREPNELQIEVAIKALEEVLALEVKDAR